MSTSPILGALFDKDGTLFDFQATWSAWLKGALLDFAKGDLPRARAIAHELKFDLDASTFDPASPVIAGTPEDVADGFCAALPDLSRSEIVTRINASAALAPQVEAVPLGPFLTDLRGLGLKLGVATNDAEAPARAHLASVGQETTFDFIAGYDSGFGGKPDPGMCLAFADAMGLDPASCVMVGDSLHDLHAGRAAGMRCVGVLTGMAQASDLAPHADAVLPNIGHLPEWISAQKA